MNAVGMRSGSVSYISIAPPPLVLPLPGVDISCREPRSAALRYGRRKKSHRNKSHCKIGGTNRDERTFNFYGQHPKDVGRIKAGDKDAFFVLDCLCVEPL